MRDKKDIDIFVGKQIKKVREAAGYTQDEFAELIQMGTKNVSAVERGMVGVSLSTIIKICTALSVSSDTLLMENPSDSDTEKLDFLMERLKNLSVEKLEIVMDVNNKLFEAFAVKDK